METIHRDSIRINLVPLCNQMVLEPLLTELVSENVFSDIDQQYILAEKTDFDRNRKVCTDIKRRGPTAYTKFINALRSSRQEHLAELLLLTEYNIEHDTAYTSYDQIPVPSVDCMEDEGPLGLFGKKTSKSMHSAKGDPIMQASDDDKVEGLQIEGSAASVGDHFPTIRYTMESDPRGYMLIINNKDFTYMGQRDGTDKDAEELKDLFEKLGYEVEIKLNLNMQEMRDSLESFSEMEGHKSVDSLVVALLTHGIQGAVCGVDCDLGASQQNILPVKEIEEIFNGKNCTLPSGKPKLFIIQACRGQFDDEGVWVEDAPTSDPEYADHLKAKRRRNLTCAPTYADMAFAFATVLDHKAYRNTVTGSPYIQKLCTIFHLCWKEKHVIDMLTLVTSEVSKLDMSNKGDPAQKKMVPQKTDTLTKFWYLNPKQ